MYLNSFIWKHPIKSIFSLLCLGFFLSDVYFCQPVWWKGFCSPSLQYAAVGRGILTSTEIFLKSTHTGAFKLSTVSIYIFSQLTAYFSQLTSVSSLKHGILLEADLILHFPHPSNSPRSCDIRKNLVLCFFHISLG